MNWQALQYNSAIVVSATHLLTVLDSTISGDTEDAFAAIRLLGNMGIHVVVDVRVLRQFTAESKVLNVVDAMEILRPLIRHRDVACADLEVHNMGA